MNVEKVRLVVSIVFCISEGLNHIVHSASYPELPDIALRQIGIVALNVANAIDDYKSSQQQDRYEYGEDPYEYGEDIPY